MLDLRASISSPSCLGRSVQERHLGLEENVRREEVCLLGTLDAQASCFCDLQYHDELCLSHVNSILESGSGMESPRLEQSSKLCRVCKVCADHHVF